MQALSTGKTNQDQVKIKGVIHNKTIIDCTYISMWTEKNKGIEWREILMLRIDHYTRMTAFFFLRKNLEAFEQFKIHKEMVETEIE
jgi:hypothetical protein